MIDSDYENDFWIVNCEEMFWMILFMEIVIEDEILHTTT